MGASEATDKILKIIATSLEEQRVEYVRRVEELESTKIYKVSGDNWPLELLKKSDILAILNGEKVRE